MLGNSFETHLPNARGINGDESHGTNSLVALNTSMFFSILMVQSSEFSLPFLNNTFSLNVSTNYIYIVQKWLLFSIFQGDIAHFRVQSFEYTEHMSAYMYPETKS